MLKIVIFDSGYGGEDFADRLESELPTTEIIRVIDRKSTDQVLKSSKNARALAEKALLPFIGKVDLIIFANYFVSATSLRYFRRKYRDQKFIGFTLKPRRIVPGRPTLILTTKAITKSLAYFDFTRRTSARTICLDHWFTLINNDDFTIKKFETELKPEVSKIKKFTPKQIFLASGELNGFKPEFKQLFGHNTRIVDSFDDTVDETFRTLQLRGRSSRKR